MDLEYSSAEQTFRNDVRKFIDAKLPRELAAKVLGHKRLTRDDIMSWHRTLHTVGWSAPTWPKQFGGPGWTSVQQHIFDEECTAAGTPPVIAFGVRMVAPVIMAY
jgi:alkylation response protein AidB-like acyl-CoA dehydrogenase